MDIALVKHLTAVFMQAQLAVNPQAGHVGSPLECAQGAAMAVAQAGPPDGISREELTAVMAVTSLHEGRNDPRIVGPARCDKAGDCGSYGAYQLDHHPELLGDAYAQARYALFVVIAGYRICPAHPLAPYAGGCNNRGAIKIADDRLAEARAALVSVLRSRGFASQHGLRARHLGVADQPLDHAAAGLAAARRHLRQALDSVRGEGQVEQGAAAGHVSTLPVPPHDGQVGRSPGGG